MPSKYNKKKEINEYERVILLLLYDSLQMRSKVNKVAIKRCLVASRVTAFIEMQMRMA